MKTTDTFIKPCACLSSDKLQWIYGLLSYLFFNFRDPNKKIKFDLASLVGCGLTERIYSLFKERKHCMSETMFIGLTFRSNVGTLWAWGSSRRLVSVKGSWDGAEGYHLKEGELQEAAQVDQHRFAEMWYRLTFSVFLRYASFSYFRYTNKSYRTTLRI